MQIGNGKQGVKIGEYSDGVHSKDDNATIGYVQPACKNPQWILWFTKKGDGILYTEREPSGAVIGEPIRIYALKNALK
jgi:hypothetical protein